MDKEIHRVAIVGAGGLGGLFGSILSSGGLDVTLMIPIEGRLKP